jgi:hypothetical protein
MGLADELRDPWGLVVSGVSGGLAWALVTGPVGVAVGVGVGAAVLGVKVASGVLLNRDQRPAEPEPARPPRGSVAAGWLERAERAVAALDDLAASARSGPLALQVTSAAQQAGDTLTALTRLGAQATAVEGALARVDAPGLDEEADRLAAAVRRGAPGHVQVEAERSLAAVRDRISVRHRLSDARAGLLARMQAVALGLEGLVARLAEVLALGATTGTSDDAAGQVAELAGELEGPARRPRRDRGRVPRSVAAGPRGAGLRRRLSD